MTESKLGLRDLSPEALGELVGLLAHDVRNPLAALSSNVGFLMMAGEGFSTNIREAISDLQLSIEVLSRITDTMEVASQELRALAGPNAGTVNFDSVISGLWAPLERAAESHGLRLRNEVPKGLRLRAAEPAFSRALNGLLHNAIPLSPAKSEVLLAARVEGSECIISVTDRGPKIAPELIEAAFSAGGQLVTKGRAQGRYSRGMGLYLVGRSAGLAGVELRVRQGEDLSTIELVVLLA